MTRTFRALLSAIVQALVSKNEMVRLLGDDSPRGITLASLFGFASSSCSYAAVALARSLFRKGARFTAAIVFEFASTNLGIELGIIMAVLLGWQFTAAELLGGPVMIVLLMAAVGLLVELVFQALRLVPATRAAIVPEARITFNYTTALNVVFPAIAGALVTRFVRTGGAGMLKMMNTPMDAP